MKKKFTNVYQFKITLMDIQPQIWRIIEVPETYSFWDLHVAIQDAMGWADYHLHHFELKNPLTGIKAEIGIPDTELAYEKKILADWKQKIADWFTLENRLAEYVYDYGDNWEHTVKLEKILPREESATYPRCVDGKRACPPEDCGGPWGYKELLEIIKDKNHEEYEEKMEWLGGEFDPEHFDVKEVIFDDPVKRRKMAFG